MSQETHWEDQMIVAALDGLERGTDPAAPGARRAETTETAETLARLYTEVLGLIPFELEPAVPRAESRQRLLATITGQVARPAAPVPPPQPVQRSIPAPIPVPIPEPIPAPAPLPASAPPLDRTVPIPALAPPEEPAAAPAPVPEAPPAALSGVRRQPPRPMPLSARRSYGWPLALAAALLLSLGLSGWLYLQQTEQRETLARFRTELLQAQQKEAAATQEAERFRREYTTLRTTMTMVTAPAAIVGALRPVGALQPDARGAIFVAADHQHWHLSIEGLKPAARDKVYQLWFEVDQGPAVNGGTFLATANERVEMTSEAMPPGTKSCMITLEEAGTAPATPKGPTVLRVEEMRQIL